MGKTIEKYYGNVVRSVMSKVNPIKKLIIKTYCTVHKYINIRAMEILKQNGYEDEYRFYLKYIMQLNKGAFYADQDFKSTNHFFHYELEKGLYGFSNALVECKKYYNLAINYARKGDIKKSVFYFGASCHLLQDTTVPQHVNNKLLKSHRAFENWILHRVTHGYSFYLTSEIKRRKSIDEYIKKNAVMSNRTYNKYQGIYDIDKKYTRISNEIIAEAESTTAGFMIDFYRKIFSDKKVRILEQNYIRECKK